MKPERAPWLLCKRPTRRTERLNQKRPHHFKSLILSQISLLIPRMNLVHQYHEISSEVTTPTLWRSSRMLMIPSSTKSIIPFAMVRFRGKKNLIQTVSCSDWLSLWSSITETRVTVEVIVLEAAYRLNTQHALTYEEIEKCNALPLTLASRPGESGLLSGSQRR